MNGTRFKLLPSGLQWHASEKPQSAVLVLLCIDQPEPYTLLTRRSPDLLHHAGQISLPGGKRAIRDVSPEHTALREAEEETGVDARHISTLGRLPALEVSSGFEIIPVVGTTSANHNLRPQPGEVDEIIMCPLQLVLDSGNYRTDSLVKNGVRRDFLALDFEGHYIWGATARILFSLTESTQ